MAKLRIMSTTNERLRQARIEAGFQTAKAAVDAFGWQEGAYRNHENGTQGRKVPLEAAKKYAAAFKVRLEWLLQGTGNKRASGNDFELQPVETGFIPVRGYTQAGQWNEFESFEDENHGDIEISRVRGPWSGLEQFAFLVKGNSMNADHIFDGDYVICVPYFEARPDIQHGDTAVIERVRNSAIERTVKEIEVEGRTVRFCPRSTSDRYKPISVKISRHMRDADDTEIRLVGLVIGTWRPRRL